MRILVAPDKYKGSLSASEVADHLTIGLEQEPRVQCIRLPLADGGDGSVDSALAAGFRPRTVIVAGPTGRPHGAIIAFDGATAVVEVANTCGISLLPGGRLEPLRSSSYGFGQAVRAAVELGPSTIVLALGGSASTDGGVGFLAALGAGLLDESGQPVPATAADLRRIDRVDLARIELPSGIALVVASDVDAELCGPRGAAYVFGPQKGADPDEVVELDHCLAHLADRLGHQGRQAARTPGAGAAGGLGFAALLLGGTVRSGAQYFLDLLRFDVHLVDTDVVVTGEGRLDDQTAQGKLPYAVAQRAAPRPTYAVVGQNIADPHSALTRAFAAIHQLGDFSDGGTRDDPALTAATLTRIGRHLSAQLGGGRGSALS